MSHWFDVLRSQQIDLTQDLVDKDGFPRSDIDIPTVREARKNIHRLRNDLKQVLAEIEKGLQVVFDKGAQSGPDEGGEGDVRYLGPANFASVNAVAPDSPAAQAGLLKGDQIVRFGTIHANNHDQLRAVGAFVKANEGVPIPLLVLRSNPASDGSSNVDQLVTLSLTPSTWGGRGLLGCHILPSNPS